MIANLIYTLMLALGVATGNVSSNSYKGGNAFNNGEKSHVQPIKKANTETIQTTWEMVNSYSDSIGWNYKYYLNNNYVNQKPIGQITATAYESTYYDGNSTNIGRAVQIIRIDPYTNVTDNDYRITIGNIFVVRDDPTNPSVRNCWCEYQSYATTQNLDEYQDLTTYNLKETIYNIQIDNTKLITSGYDGQEYALTNMQEIDTTAELVIPQRSANQTFWILVRSNIALQDTQYYQNQYVRTKPKSFYWQATYLPVNYEVVDIPNLMFTILTLPFAWYSTAFNLTVFPGTPYALNFGNIVLTIVAALMLIYLIKKVLK